ncbi:MAG: hypothetical protein R2799_05410 [Crocinitomicaceae bacterium]
MNFVLSAAAAVALIFSSCQPEDPTPSNNNSNATAMFTATIDGASYEMIVTTTSLVQQGYSDYTSIDSQTSPVTFTGSWGSSMYNYSTNESAEVAIGQLTWTGATLPAYNDWKALFNTGSKNYIFGGDGVRIAIDEANVYWTTSSGTADQTGSTFTITSMTEKTISGIPHIEIEASFSCKLYDGNGGSRTLTNGYFKGQFQYAD